MVGSHRRRPGDAGKLGVCRAAMVQSGCGHVHVSESRAGGSRPSVRKDVARSTCPAWGVRVRRRTRPVPISTGLPGKSRSTKSSTTRGPSRHGVKGLPVSSTEDDAEQGKDRRRWVEGCFWFLPLESTLVCGVRTRAWRLRRGGSPGRATTVPPGHTGYRRDRSDGVHRERGNLCGDRIGLRCPGGDARVIQTPQRGSVA